MLNRFKALWKKDIGFGFFFAVSALSHIIIFVSLLFTSSGNNRLLRNTNAIDVNLISISKAGSIKNENVSPHKKTAEKPVAVKETKPKKEAEKKPQQKKIKEIEKAESKKTIPTKNAKEAKKKVEKESKQEKNTEADRAKVANAIDKIRESMAANQPSDNPEIFDTKKGEGGFSSMEQGRPGSIIGNIVSAYQAEVAWRIEQNWFFSGQTTGKQNVKTVLIIEIMKSGEIKEVYFETKSGSPYLDDSAYKAVLKSNPLPPLPEAFGVSSYKLGLTFTPSGIE